MAKYQILVEGFDPTSVVTAITRAELLAEVHEAEFVDNVGAIIRAQTAPNVALYPKLGFFIWHELDGSNRATGKLYVHDGTDWIPSVPANGSISGDQIADGSIGFEKLDIGSAAVGYILRIGAGLVVEAVPLSSIIGAGSLALSTLVPAAGDDYIIRSSGGGSWSAVGLASYLISFLATNRAIPHTGIFDGDNTGAQHQVLGRSSGANAGVTWSYIESLLRANQTPTAKLQFNPSLWGKRVKVNSSGTDLEEDATSSATKVAILKYSGVTNTAAQVVADVTETTVQFNTLINPQSAISSLDPSTYEITLETGTYEFDLSVPIYETPDAVEGILMIRDRTNSNAIIATTSFQHTGDVDESRVSLKHLVVIAAATNTYDIRIYVDSGAAGVTLGTPSNIGTYAETYQQLSIRKLA